MGKVVEEESFGNGLLVREVEPSKTALHKAIIEASLVDAKDSSIEFLKLSAVARYENGEKTRHGFMRFVAKELSEGVIRELGVMPCPLPYNEDYHNGNGFDESEDDNTIEAVFELMDVGGVQAREIGKLRSTEEISRPTKVLRIKATYDKRT